MILNHEKHLVLLPKGVSLYRKDNPLLILEKNTKVFVRELSSTFEYRVILTDDIIIHPCTLPLINVITCNSYNRNLPSFNISMGYFSKECVADTNTVVLNGVFTDSDGARFRIETYHYARVNDKIKTK